MFDIMLPISIVRAEKNFLFDDDYGDFENDSILRYYRKDDQQKIKSRIYFIKIFHKYLLFIK
jgi:hypothetical protein